MPQKSEFFLAGKDLAISKYFREITLEIMITKKGEWSKD